MDPFLGIISRSVLAEKPDSGIWKVAGWYFRQEISRVNPNTFLKLINFQTRHLGRLGNCHFRWRETIFRLLPIVRLSQQTSDAWLGWSLCWMCNCRTLLIYPSLEPASSRWVLGRPLSGIEPEPLDLRYQSSNHWDTSASTSETILTAFPLLE